MKSIVRTLLIGGVLALALPAVADSLATNFDSPMFTLGTINGQNGWTSFGAAGLGCAKYDHAVSPSLGTSGFGDQSLRISNAVTSGCFGDQTFAAPLQDGVGEIDSSAGTFATGTLQRHFEMQFDIASVVPNAEQPGLMMSVSPDRGDGSRMSYLRFEDHSDGIQVFFDDVEGTSNPANFVETKIATLNRAVPHTIKLTLDALDGPSNDLVRVYVDGTWVHTGISWENYYRYDSEASTEQHPRVIKTVLFRTGGVAAPNTLGKGFLIDNLSLLSGTVPPPIDMNQCKYGYWTMYNNPSFKNQGQCVSYVTSNNHTGNKK